MNQNLLEISHPSIYKEWDFDKNDIKPYLLTFGSNYKAFWECEKGHSWQETIKARTRKKDGRCPICLSIFSTHPFLIKEWDYVENQISPNNVTKGSDKKVYWNCFLGHSWQATVASRTSGGANCPVCRNKTSFAEQAIYFYMKKIFKNSKNRHRKKIKNVSYELDIYIPEIDLGIEYDGFFYHKNKFKKDYEKKLKLSKDIKKLIVIRERGLERLNIYNVKEIIRDGENKSSLNETINSIVDNLKNYKKDYREIKIDVEKDYQKIKESYIFEVRKDNLSKTVPTLASQWHPIKNGRLKPKYFQPTSHHLAYWKCPFNENHSVWKASIKNRVKSNKKFKCPECLGKRANKENNLKILRPDLMKFWDYKKNIHLKPESLRPGSDKVAFWICGMSPDHNWESGIYNFSRSGRCPYCAGTKLSITNCLQTKNPYLAEEWDPIGNGELTPYDVFPSSKMKVLWICRKNKNHKWGATLNNRNNGKGCPKC